MKEKTLPVVEFFSRVLLRRDHEDLSPLSSISSQTISQRLSAEQPLQKARPIVPKRGRKDVVCLRGKG
jgi:hypothetical protein